MEKDLPITTIISPLPNNCGEESEFGRNETHSNVARITLRASYAWRWGKAIGIFVLSQRASGQFPKVPYMYLRFAARPNFILHYYRQKVSLHI